MNKKAIYIFTAILIIAVTVSCSNMLSYKTVPIIGATQEISLPTSDGTVRVTAIDSDSDGVIDGLDLDGVASTLELEFTTVDTVSGVYPIDLDADGTADIYILIDYDGTIIMNTMANNQGDSATMVVDSDDEITGIEYDDSATGAEFTFASGPVPGASGTITAASVTDTTLTLNWTKATDDVTAESAIQYRVYYSSSDNISSVDTIVTNGLPLNSYTADIATLNVTGLSASTTYYFNVIVKDEAGDTSVYSTMTQATGVLGGDYTAPTAGNSGVMTTDSITANSLTLTWVTGTDDTSFSSALEYRVYYSTSDNIDSVANIEANGTAINSYTSDIATLNVTGLTAGSTYYFNVIVKDEAGNQTAYTAKEQATTP